VLALTVYSLIEWLAQERGIGLTGRKITGLFAGIGLLRQKDGQKRSVFYLLGVEPRHDSLLSAFDLKPITFYAAYDTS
jgi:hypothetical protein